MERLADDETFGSELVAFAAERGLDLSVGEELSEDDLDEVVGGALYQTSTYTIMDLKYSIAFPDVCNDPSLDGSTLDLREP